jgi:predicted enzyme related to lactoylglutathione lyase
MAAKLGLVLDCADPDKLAGFWSAAIGYASLGGAGNYVILVDEAGQQPKLLLQRVDEPKSGKNRMHFDIHVADIEAEASRLIALGGRRVEDDQREEHGTHWVLMADPEGNEFCICDSGTAHD